jgi:radical SAM superfamily enzyme YgiQ (UPF0313 family)
MKIKLILAASPTDPLRRNDPFMPLSLPILAGAAPEHDYTFVDLLWEDDVGYDEPADLVGISVRSTAQERAFEIADEFRKRGRTVVLGGPQVSAVARQAREHADAVAVGEGETLWPVIVADAGEGKLRDYYVCSPEPFQAGEGQMVYQESSFPDLSVPLAPKRHLYRRKYTFDTVYAMRGCPIDCDFCAVSRLFGTAYRRRRPQDVVDEINSFKGYYYLLDDTVLGRASTYDYYLDLYDRIAALPRRRYFTGQANLNAASDEKGREVIRRAARAGFLYAAVGIESINPATLEASGAIRKLGVRGADEVLERMRQNIRFIQDQGIIISGWFVVGYPQDTVETFYQTYEFCREMDLLPAIFHVRAIPGTRLYERLQREGKLDTNRLMNMGHPSIRDEDILDALAYVIRKGYSLREIVRRCFFYAGRFRGDLVHKTIFAFVTQKKLKGGLDVAHVGARKLVRAR